MFNMTNFEYGQPVMAISLSFDKKWALLFSEFKLLEPKWKFPVRLFINLRAGVILWRSGI